MVEGVSMEQIWFVYNYLLHAHTNMVEDVSMEQIWCVYLIPTKSARMCGIFFARFPKTAVHE